MERLRHEKDLLETLMNLPFFFFVPQTILCKYEAQFEHLSFITAKYDIAKYDFEIFQICCFDLTEKDQFKRAAIRRIKDLKL